MGLQARPLIPARQFQQSGADRRLYSLRHEIERQVPGCGGCELGIERKAPIEVQPDPVPFVAAVYDRRRSCCWNVGSRRPSLQLPQTAGGQSDLKQALAGQQEMTD